MPDSADIREINFLGRKCASAMFVYFQGSPEMGALELEVLIEEVAS